MKKTMLLSALFVFTFIAFSARAVLPGVNGSVTVSLTAMAESYSYKLTSSSTNHSGTNTFITAVYKSKTTNAPIDNPALLGLLENSFSLTFPAGAKLVISGTGSFSFLVVDKTGTNIVLNPGRVLTIGTSTSLHSGIATDITKISPSRTTFSSTDTEMYTDIGTLNYDDSSMAQTKDGTVTRFSLTGIITETRTQTFPSGKTTLSVNFHGAGDGQIRGKAGMILNGTVTGSLTGFVSLG